MKESKPDHIMDCALMQVPAYGHGPHASDNRPSLGKMSSYIIVTIQSNPIQIYYVNSMDSSGRGKRTTDMTSYTNPTRSKMSIQKKRQRSNPMGRVCVCGNTGPALPPDFHNQEPKPTQPNPNPNQTQG